ncbi:hypothetical protein ABFY43_19985 [Bacillus pumilus]
MFKIGDIDIKNKVVLAPMGWCVQLRLQTDSERIWSRFSLR